MFSDFVQRLVKWLDPKLEKYRVHRSNTKSVRPTPPPKYTPKSLEDFIGVLKRTPHDVLSKTDRARIAAVMSFDDRKVSELMIPKSEMVFVKTTEVLGPLVLDKLYKSGFTSFPVVDTQGKVKGIIHTDALNTLEIKKTDRASKYLNQNFDYLKLSDTLSHAVDEVIRLNSCYFLVLDESGALAGFLNIEILLNYLLGK